ncbi:hypothetical protein ACJRO7_016310 [Eucalyptus globulus]|uniref:Secreted protein n=1 Tax=Eucalyptus globulus TaxID=34317 RepID=A0ABD3L6P3_EUCGL
MPMCSFTDVLCFVFCSGSWAGTLDQQTTFGSFIVRGLVQHHCTGLLNGALSSLGPDGDDLMADHEQQRLGVGSSVIIGVVGSWLKEGRCSSVVDDEGTVVVSWHAKTSVSAKGWPRELLLFLFSLYCGRMFSIV